MTERREDGAGGDALRRNGEIVFEEPWQSRAFGMVLALTENAVCDYAAFREHLIATIGAWDDAHGATPEAVYEYYERWLESLERLLDERGVLSADEIDARAAHLGAADRHDHD